MMKKGLLFFLVSLFTLCGCGSNSVTKNEFSATTNQQALGDFGLLSPVDGDTYFETPTFTWEESQNATSYTLEIASTIDFVTLLDTEVYYKKTNIASTSFTIQANLSKRNTTYYWRVTAVNDAYSKVSNTTKSFYYSANDIDEVQFSIGEADDWSLHQLGSYADVSINNSDFFGNGKPSLVVSFEKENTNQGITQSDGWLVLTRTVEKDLYGPDSLYLNFYYSGNDANMFIRLIDKDNEYWVSQVQISNNAKQGVILKFSDFVQRTQDVTVANKEFNYEHIKYFEIVFERAFGDGVCLLNDIKGVKFDNYKNLFIDELDFGSFGENDYAFENYNFDLAIEEKQFTMSYSNSANDKNEKGINGYGFTRLIANRYFVTGDAIELEVKYNGAKGSNVLLRIYEQDLDRWSFKIPFANLTADEYFKVVIPYNAFGKSSINGDGARQFYYIINLQFGLEGIYGAGSLTWRNFKIVNKKDVVDTSTRIIAEDGLIDNFDGYNSSAELLYKWNVGTTNKDEMMELESSDKPNKSSNAYSLSMAYKSDMGPAIYTLPVDMRGLSYNAISVCLKDKSAKADNIIYSYLDNVHPEFALVLTLKSGEEYRYLINSLDSAWYEYVIPFSSFLLTSEDIANPLPITCDGIGYVTLAMQYYYKTQDGKSSPAYTQGNVVLADSLKLANGNEISKTLMDRVISPSSEDAKVALIDDFEYASQAGLNNSWNNILAQVYGQPTLSSDVSSQGGASSMRLSYVGNEASPKVVTDVTVSSSTKGKSLVLDLKGDDKATVYINLYLTQGSSQYQYRATLTSVTSSWNRYAIGFNNFALVSSTSGLTLSQTTLVYVTKITFGVVNYVDKNESSIYIDNLSFNANNGYTTNTKTAL